MYIPIYVQNINKYIYIYIYCSHKTMIHDPNNLRTSGLQFNKQTNTQMITSTSY